MHPPLRLGQRPFGLAGQSLGLRRDGVALYILIVENSPEHWQSLVQVLDAGGHRTERVASGGAALAALARPVAPQLVLIEERMPDMSAIDFLEAAARMSTAVPVAVLGSDESAARWVETTRRGAVDYIVTDEDGDFLTTLAPRLRSALERASSGDRVARLADALASTAAPVILADRAGRIEFLNVAARRLLAARGGEGNLGTLSEIFPLDEQPRVKGDLFAAMHVGGEWAGEVQVVGRRGERVPCMVTLSPVRRSQGRTDGLILTLRDVSDRVAMEAALRAANRRLAEQASRDPLTRIYNRGYFLEVLEREIARAIRYGDELSVLMIDQDGFKLINDRLGHAVGDMLLIEVSRTLRSGLRDGDVLARYGGDEFVILLPNTDAESAMQVAERLRSDVWERGYGPDGTVKAKICIGVASSGDVPRGTKKPTDAMLSLADKALYKAKRGGGNAVESWTEELGV